MAFAAYNNSILGNDHKEYYLLECWFFFLNFTLVLLSGDGYKLCDGSMTNPKDTCYKCPNGTYNRARIDTAKVNFKLDACTSIDCSCHGKLCPSLTLYCTR